MAGGDLVLEITASEDTWFRMRSGGQVQFNAVLKKGETRTLRGDGAADILVGNAGGLNIVWNGKPLGPIGPRGQVRTVKITAEGAQVTDPRAERKQSEEQPEQRQQM